jgi:hypothetical protein
MRTFRSGDKVHKSVGGGDGHEHGAEAGVPTGVRTDWLPCDGRRLPVAEYPELAKRLARWVDPERQEVVLPDYENLQYHASGTPAQVVMSLELEGTVWRSEAAIVHFWIRVRR